MEHLHPITNSDSDFMTQELRIKKEVDISCDLVLNKTNIEIPDSQEFTIKHEDIDIKMDEDDYNRIQDTDTMQFENKDESDPQAYLFIDENGSKAVKDHSNMLLSSLSTIISENKLEYVTNVSNTTEVKKEDKDLLEAHTPIDQRHPKLLYHCEKCEYKTVNRHCIKRHLLTHMDPSELTMFNCERCEYKSKYKGHLKRHIICHQDSSQVKMYQCESCEYKSSNKCHLTRHRLSHRAFSEVTMYRCQQCTFETKYTDSLRSHLLIHQDTSEATLYRCDKCEFNTKYRHSLKTHLLNHQDSSEVAVHQCGKCGFKTKYRQSLRNHVLKHIDSSEVTMYQCEQCEYKTKRKRLLKNHFIDNHILL